MRRQKIKKVKKLVRWVRDMKCWVTIRGKIYPTNWKLQAIFLTGEGLQ